MNTLETLQELLMKAYPLTREQVTPDALLATVGVDSLGLIELMFEIEDRFGITLSDENKMPPIVTIRNLVAYIDSIVALQGTTAPPPAVAAAAATPVA
jgi:acyl carrier protein